MQSPGAVGGMGLSEGRPLLPPSLPMAFHPDHHGMMMPVPISQPQQHHHHQLASPTASSQATSSTQIQEAHRWGPNSLTTLPPNRDTSRRMISTTVLFTDCFSTTNGSQSEAHSVDIKREFESEMERDKRAIYRWVRTLLHTSYILSSLSGEWIYILHGLYPLFVAELANLS